MAAEEKRQQLKHARSDTDDDTTKLEKFSDVYQAEPVASAMCLCTAALIRAVMRVLEVTSEQ